MILTIQKLRDRSVGPAGKYTGSPQALGAGLYQGTSLFLPHKFPSFLIFLNLILLYMCLKATSKIFERQAYILGQQQ